VPRYVDADQRRSDIIEAAGDAISQEGYARFTLRSLARRMGGSSTLVTHYFPTKDELMVALTGRVLAESRDRARELEAIEDPMERLRNVLVWFLPVDDEGMRQERVRVALASHRDSEPSVAVLLDQIDPVMRDVLKIGLRGIVAPTHLDATLDVVRAWASGVALLFVEHPQVWTAERQMATLDEFIEMLPLHLAPVERDGEPGRRRSGSTDGSRPGRPQAQRRTSAAR